MGTPREHRPQHHATLNRTRAARAAITGVVVVLAAGGCTSTASTPGSTERTGAPTSGASADAPSGELPSGDRARVERVVDGDTIIAGGERVRLIGMDAPESVKPDSPVECYGPEASMALKQLLPPRTMVLLEYGRERRDRYGRVLAYVWLTGPPRMVNVTLVRDGYATVATFPPNVAHLDALQAAEDSARAARRGLWQACR